MSTTVKQSDLSDIHPDDWVDRHLPLSLRPYARLARIDRPIGIWLTLFPCIAALIQASSGMPTLRELIVFSLGAILMRSAGSTINDIADRDFDGHVERTRFRPLAAGTIDLRRASIFLMVELILAASLLLFLKPLTVGLALIVLPFVFVYPFCKRFTYWPQAVLGVSFNWGMLMAWSEVAGYIPLGAILIWLGAVCWQIGYDTIYGYVDAGADAKLGLRSTALLFAARGRAVISLFYLLTVAAWSIGGWMVGMTWPYHIGVGIIAVQLAWQVYRFDLDHPSINFRMFHANIGTGAVLAGSALLGCLVV